MINRIKNFYKQTGNYFQYALHAHFLIISAILITVISLIARFSVSLYPTWDVIGYVFKWMASIKEVGLANFYIKYGKYAEAMAVYDSLENLTPDINY